MDAFAFLKARDNLEKIAACGLPLGPNMRIRLLGDSVEELGILGPSIKINKFYDALLS